MKSLKLLYKIFLTSYFLYSFSNANQLGTQKNNQEIEILPGYNYKLVGEVPDSVYEKASHEYDWTGDGLNDEYGTGSEGYVSLWECFREESSISKDTIEVFKFKGLLAKIEVESIGNFIGNLRVIVNEDSTVDLLTKYQFDDTVKVFLYKNKVENSVK